MKPMEPNTPQFWLARANWGIWLFAATMIGVGALSLTIEVGRVDPTGGAALLMIALVAGPLGAILLSYAWLRNPSPRLVPAAVRVEDGGLWIEGLRRVVPRARIREGLLVRRNDGSVLVRLERSWSRPIELVARDRVAAEWLLASMRLDVGGNRARFPLSVVRYRRGLWLGAALLAVFGLPAMTTVPLVGCLLLSASAVALMLVLWPARVDVGSDGLTVRQLGGRRFIAHARIEYAYRFGRPDDATQGVELLLTDGTTVQLRTRSGFTAELTADRTDRLLQRVVDARSRWRGAVSQLTVLLDDAHREPNAWVRALRDAVRGGHPHRSVHLDPEELWAVLEDPGSAPAARSGAAIALGTRTDAAGRDRIRVAARATASDEVRHALELAAEEDAEDERLAAALAPLLRVERP